MAQWLLRADGGVPNRCYFMTIIAGGAQGGRSS